MRILAVIFCISNLLFCASAAAGNNNIQQTQAKQSAFSSGFADIVEPLVPAVVNIYTVKYKKINRSPNLGAFPEGFLFNQFNDLVEQFNLPFIFDENYSDPKAVALGSGFIIDPAGYIVTNYHVVNNVDEISVKLSDNTELSAKMIGSDQRTDLALLKVESKTPLAYVKFGDSTKARVGDWVIAIGNPLGLGGTVTTGIISSKGRDIDAGSSGFVDDYIQTDAAINLGNSGGAMFNVEGEVIGVNSAIISPSGFNIGIGFAIPSSTASKIIEELRKSGKIKRGKLDIVIQNISNEIAEGLGLEKQDGVLVIDVIAGNAGDKFGIKIGDIIYSFNGVEVKNRRKLQVLVAEALVDQNVKIGILRDGKHIELTGKITEPEELITKPKILGEVITKVKEASLERGGIIFNNLTPDLREKFSVKENINGIIITAASNDKRFMGIKIGDIVLSINQQAVLNIDDAAKIYDAAKASGKKNAVLLVKRQGINIYVAVPI